MKPDGAIEIVRQLRAKGHEAYLVGGCVRDMVMGIEPSDYDIATSAPPPEIIKIFPHTEAIGIQFGVVLVIHRGHPFEVATFRSDQAYIDGRRPTGVIFTDAKTDVFRRDFTINGLLYDPIEKRVIDYVSGQEDIQARVLRAIGNPCERFAEDKLRLLRAVRFAARFDYEIEPATWEAVCAMASQLGQVSQERISAELQRILTEGRAGRGLRLLHESGLLREILPEVEWTDHVQECAERITLGAPFDFALAVLLHHVPLADANRVVERLKLSKADMQQTIAFVKDLPQYQVLRTHPTSVLKRLLRRPRFEGHLELARVCAAVSGRGLDDVEFAQQQRRFWSEDELAPPGLLSGDDLIAMGFTPGPRFKEILVRLEDEQLEGRLLNRADAIDFVNAHYGARI